MKNLRRKLEFIRQQIKDLKLRNPNLKAPELADNVIAVIEELEGYAHALEDILGDVKLTKD